jgi:multidrug efflux pump subunit AcrA (membrane-fusion protein)
MPFNGIDVKSSLLTFAGRLCLVIALPLIVSCRDEAETITPAIGPLTESVYASVIVEPELLYQANANATGILEAVLVKEGDSVAAGQPLFRIRNENPSLNVSNARATVELARANLRGNQTVLDDLRTQISNARSVVQNDSLNLARQRALWNQKIGSKSDLEKRELALEASQNSLRRLQNQTKRTRNDLQTQLEQAENNFKLAQSNASEFVVYSQLEGAVYDVFVDAGEVVTPQTALAIIGSKKDYLLNLRLDEVDITRIAEGQKILVNLDAYDAQVFYARLTKVYLKKDERTQTFKAEAVFETAPPKLYYGLAGEANILITEKDMAMTIPLVYLLEGNRVIANGDTVAVVTGIRNLERVEILSGLDAAAVLTKPK